MAFADHVMLRERKDASVTWRSLDPKTRRVAHPIAIDEAVYDLGNERNLEFAAKTYRYSYSSPTTPDSIYDADARDGARTLLKHDVRSPASTPSATHPSLHATARDGTSVPISIVHTRGTRRGRDAPAPPLRATVPTASRATCGSTRPLVSLLDRGVVSALAHIRGGGDLGKAWHDGGRMASKMNTFTDFIDSAEWLTKAGWAKAGDIGIQGRSAGGLLMGAVTNMRPDLWRAVVAGMPFVDVLNTMLDESLPLTTVEEFEEWGNPKIPEQFGWMIAYSPYDNVAKKNYPAMLIETSYNDSQVMYWEPAKWTAKLRAMKTDSNLLYLKTNMELPATAGNPAATTRCGGAGARLRLPPRRPRGDGSARRTGE